jgi:drug/metabolite transporter (DMT)-like permease
MNATLFALTLACVLAISAGQILFKLAARTATAADGFSSMLLNGYFYAALAVYAVATVLWVWLLKTLPLNVAYPFVGLAFVIVPLLGAWLLNEPLDWRHLLGGALIAGGVAVASWR